MLKLKQKAIVSTGKNKVQSKVAPTKIIESLEVVDIDSVHPWEKNPRKNEKAVERLSKVIAQYGQRTPISVWRKDRAIYKGNTTWMAMKKAGYKKIAVMWQDFKDTREARGYAMVDNASGEWSDWDMNMLAELLQGEEFQGMQSSEISKLTGFDDKMLKGLLLTTTELPDVLPDVDLTGQMPDKADFIVIQFESKDAMQKFKQKLGFQTKHPRVVPYEDLLKVMEWKVQEYATAREMKKKIVLKKKG